MISQSFELSSSLGEKSRVMVCYSGWYIVLTGQTESANVSSGSHETITCNGARGVRLKSACLIEVK